MSWLILLIAGVFEVSWAAGLKYSEGFKKLVPSIITIVALIASVILLSLAMKILPVGTAYAVWTGICAIGTVILGIFVFKEPANPTKAYICSIYISRYYWFENNFWKLSIY